MDERFENILEVTWLFSWLREGLGVADAFLDRLWTDDDWTLIIKLHSMIEAGMNHLILNQLGNPKLERVIAKLDTSNPATGKAAFVKAFALLPDKTLRFIQILSEIRNACVHDARNFTFNLEAHVATFEKKQLANWLDCLTVSMPETMEFRSGEMLPTRTLFKVNPRFGVITATLQIMSAAYSHSLEQRLSTTLAELHRVKAGLYDEHLESTPKE